MPGFMVSHRGEVNGAHFRRNFRQDRSKQMGWTGPPAMPDRTRQRPTPHQPGIKPGTTHEQRERRERFQRTRRDTLRPEGDVRALYGWHPVKAALENPARQVRKLL